MDDICNRKLKLVAKFKIYTQRMHFKSNSHKKLRENNWRYPLF